MLNYRALISTITVMAFLAIWEIAPRAGIVDAVYTSQPSRVIAAGLEIVSTDGFLHDVFVSLSEFAVGFVLAIGIGVPLGLLLVPSGVSPAVSKRSCLVAGPVTGACLGYLLALVLRFPDILDWALRLGG